MLVTSKPTSVDAVGVPSLLPPPDLPQGPEKDTFTVKLHEWFWAWQMRTTWEFL